MKNIIFVYAAFNIDYPFVKAFGSNSELSAFEKVLFWAKNTSDCGKIVLATNSYSRSKVDQCLLEIFGEEDKNLLELKKMDNWNTLNMLELMTESCTKHSAETALVAFGDTPFISKSLTEEILMSHQKYVAEYSFQDGWPDGFAPEAINSGTLNILLGFARQNPALGEKAPFTDKSIFNLLNKDINSFDVETVMAPRDFRLLRLKFAASSKALFMASKRLHELASEKLAPEDQDDVLKLSELAEKDARVQKTVPAFYNIQIESACSTFASYSPYPFLFEKKYSFLPKPGDDCRKVSMSLSDFTGLVDKISNFSQDAVVSLSVFGDCLLHEDFIGFAEAVLSRKNLSLLVETDGIVLDESICQRMSGLLNSCPAGYAGFPKLMWIVNVDAVTESMYGKIHQLADEKLVPQGKTPFQCLQENLVLLSRYFPEKVYPQFTRMNVNEAELEAFYRLYHDQASMSQGNIIVQKYSTFCGILPDEKPADLSPVTRNTCWHLKRDMTILADGNVPLCREQPFAGTLGNAFSDELETVWAKSDEIVQKQIESCLSHECRNCDEYYTFNF